MSMFHGNRFHRKQEQITEPGAGGGSGGGNPNPGAGGDPGGDDGGDPGNDPGQDPNGQRNAGGGDDPGTGGLDYNDPAATKAEIERLRKENAKWRTSNKDLKTNVEDLNGRLGKFETGLKKLFGEEESDLTPEQQIEVLSQQNEALEVQSAMRDAAYEFGVPRENYDYFEFLVSKRLGELGEGDEFTEEDLEALAKEANGKTASSTTSVGDGKGDPNPAGDDGGITLEEFSAMGIGQRSALYQKDKALYDKLSAQEKAAKLKR